MLDWFLEEESEIQWGCTLKMSPEVEINISRVPLDTSKPKPRNMLKQEHGLIRHCTVSAMSVSTIHTSLILQKVRQSVYRNFYTKVIHTYTRYPLSCSRSSNNWPQLNYLLGYKCIQNNSVISTISETTRSNRKCTVLYNHPPIIFYSPL